MALIDKLIVAVYLLGMVLTGLYFQKRAAGSIDSYFLGNKKMPWWALGASGMASNLDISGTMISIALIYALGMRGFYIELRGGIVLIMAFLLAFMGKWNRRSSVMTMAEWMNLRFGNGPQGQLARIIAAAATLITTVWIVTYFAVGSGKFIGEFLGIPPIFGLRPEFWAGALMISLAMIYTVASGLYGVVWTDVFQGALIFVTIISICFIAFTQFQIPDVFNLSIPMQDGSYQMVESSRESWTHLLPSWHLDIPLESSYSVYTPLGFIIFFYMLKVIIEGSGGTGGYMIQRYLAARDDREAGLLSLLWTGLLSFRWPFIASIALMGVVYSNSMGMTDLDPERVLPLVIQNLVPVGLKGLLIAGLMAAAMSTFDSIVNAGAAYWVKDIYQNVINPQADHKTLVSQGRWASLLIVALGLFFSLNIQNLNDIWSWLTMGIGSGMIIPLVIRWYWWRLNGYGFSAGVISGMLAAILLKLTFPALPEHWTFLSVISISTVGTLVGTWLTPETSHDVLRGFYQTTRPFGFWKPIRQDLAEAMRSHDRIEHRRDLASTALAVPWQLSLFLTGMAIMVRRWDYVLTLGLSFVLLSIGLYFTWFRHLKRLNEPSKTLFDQK